MCGRMVVDEPDIGELVKEYGVTEQPTFEWTPRYNLAPTQLAPIVTNDPQRRITLARFGLVPFWSENERTGNKLINARVETVATRSTFREALAAHRCIVPVSGYYEWRKVNGEKQPLFIYDESGRRLALAGLWARWRAPDGTRLESFAVLTRAAEGFLRDIHDRMPLEVPLDQIGRWLDPERRSAAELAAILRAPADPQHLQAYEVSALVNSPRNDSPECLTPAAPRASQLDLFDAVMQPGTIARARQITQPEPDERGAETVSPARHEDEH
jgi:putative SOS response-associated peptidase YedK